MILLKLLLVDELSLLTLIWIRLVQIMSWWLLGLDLLVLYQVALKQSKARVKKAVRKKGEKVMSRFMVKTFFTQTHRSLLV